MRIGLNLLHANEDVGGVWNYMRGMLSALGKHDTENKYFCYCSDESENLIPQNDNFLHRKVKIFGRNRIQRIFYENFLLPFRIKADKLDCLHWFANVIGIYCPVFSVVTIYDLLSLEQPNNFSVMHRLYYNYMFPRSVHKANVLAPMSKSTADNISRIFNTELSRIVVIPPVVDNKFKKSSPERVKLFRKKYKLPDKFWLYVAHFYPHKNHKRLLEAYIKNKQSGNNTWPLVLRGDEKEGNRQNIQLLVDTNILNDVIFLPRLDVNEMPTLYSSASAMVFPSFYEGGGIPVLEAMACGCPVTASRIPTNIEFAGNAALLFDPISVEGIAESMLKFENYPDIREKYCQRGINKVKLLRSRIIADLLVSSYKRTYLFKSKGMRAI